ncbi:hypothetical protein [Archaeoglobus neptunius]|uniref:hypothetical protein n=1 Tax=Archaeoglobus neptunius TaxID=2798580 RepID=UPI00192905E5|nr:hypothetical protein [Archaeoglobus neptunius]
MLYINTFLDRLGELVRGEKNIELAGELTDQKRIVDMFRRDCEEILELYKNGKASHDEVRKNLHLLKTYVVSQLSLHFEKVKELAKSKGIEINANLEPEVVNEIALYIDKIEKEL